MVERYHDHLSPKKAMSGRTKRGRISITVGCMYSGKSSDLCRRVRRARIAGKNVQVFKSALDDRAGYGGVEKVSSHDGMHMEGTPVRNAMEILTMLSADTDVVAIDEVQFLDDAIVDVVRELADTGLDVIIAGLDMDYRGNPFGPVGPLMAIAEEVTKLDAVCVRCGGQATRNQRLIDGQPAPADGPTVLVGARDHYEARCVDCHEVPRSATRTRRPAAV